MEPCYVLLLHQDVITMTPMEAGIRPKRIGFISTKGFANVGIETGGVSDPFNKSTIAKRNEGTFHKNATYTTETIIRATPISRLLYVRSVLGFFPKGSISRSISDFQWKSVDSTA